MWEKLQKSEFVVALVAMLATLLASKLGLPSDQLQAVIMGIIGLAGTYVAGRSYAKPREAAAANPTAASKPL